MGGQDFRIFKGVRRLLEEQRLEEDRGDSWRRKGPWALEVVGGERFQGMRLEERGLEGTVGDDWSWTRLENKTVGRERKRKPFQGIWLEEWLEGWRGEVARGKENGFRETVGDGWSRKRLMTSNTIKNPRAGSQNNLKIVVPLSVASRNKFASQFAPCLCWLSASWNGFLTSASSESPKVFRLRMFGEWWPVDDLKHYPKPMRRISKQSQNCCRLVNCFLGVK